MDDEVESFPVTLGGRRWELPHLAGGVVRKLQPRLLRLNAAMRGETAEEAGFRVDEAALEELTDIAVLALSQVDPGVTRGTLDGLRIRPVQLISAQIAFMRACGMEPAKGGEGTSDPKA